MIRSDEGPTLEKSVLEALSSGQLIISTELL